MASDTPLPLDEPTELTGEWWIPGSREATASGRLVYAPDDRLELHTTSGNDVFQHHEPIPWVHGLTVDGRPVTLRNCFVLNWSFNMPGGIAARVYAQQAFVGMYAESDAELSMLSLRARIVNLSEWVGVTGLSVDTIKKRVMSIQYAQPGPRGLGRAERALLTVAFEPVGQAEPARTPFRLTLEQQSWFQIEPRRARPFDDLQELLTRFCGFLSFAAGVDCAVTELQGRARVPIEEIGPGRVTLHTMPVWVLYARTTTRASQQAADRMLFRYAELQAHNLRPLGRWYRNWSKLGPVVNVYLSGLPTRTLHLEYRFLAYAQALEAFHYRKKPRYMTLHARLDDLGAGLPAPIRRIVPTGFTKLAKDTRNYFTHWNPKLEARAAKGEQLVQLTRAVKLLFEITLLMELGFTKTQIAQAVLEKNQRLVREVATSFLEL